jgi:hypothetical protein
MKKLRARRIEQQVYNLLQANMDRVAKSDIVLCQ